MLLAEDALLLVTTDDEGKNLAGSWLGYMLSAALLIDLSFAGNIRITEKGEIGVRRNRVVAVPETPWPTDPLLAETLTLISGKSSWNPQYLVQRLLPKLNEKIYDRLVEHEMVTRSETRVLGMIPLRRYPALDSGYERGLLERIDQALLFGAEPDEQTAALIGLLFATDMLTKVVDRGRRVDRRLLRRRGKEICEQHWAAKAAKDAIAAVVAGAAISAAT